MTMPLFMDTRLPLAARLEKLAILIGSEQGLPEHRTEAEALIRRAASLLVESIDAVTRRTEQNGKLTMENQRLLGFCEMLETENRRLRNEAEDFWRTHG